MRHPASLLVLLALAPLGVAADLYVETAGADATNDCTASAAPCATLEHALSVAVPGDTLNLGAGMFSSTATAYPLTLPHSVSLIGAGASLTTVNAATATLVRASSASALHIQDLTLGGDATTVLNGRFGGNGPVDASLTATTIVSAGPPSLRLSGTSSASGTIAITQSTLTGGTQQSEIFVERAGPWQLPFTGNTVSGGGVSFQTTSSTTNVFADTYDTTITVANNTLQSLVTPGITVRAGRDTLVDVDVHDNVFQDSPHDALQIWGWRDHTKRVNISDNVFDNVGQAIDLSTGDASTTLAMISGNTITNTTYAGISAVIDDSTAIMDVTITGNVIDRAGRNGLNLGITDSSSNAYRATVIGNTITNCDGHGISMSDSYDSSNNMILELRNNTITDNGGDGIYIDADTGAFNGLFTGNIITGNADNGVRGRSDYVGFFLNMKHNTIHGNNPSGAAGRADINMDSLRRYDVFANDNWFGTTDRDVIDAMILDTNDSSPGQGQVHYTALSPLLAFHASADHGPTDGSQTVALVADEGAPPFVWTTGAPAMAHPLVVTFDGVEAELIQLSDDGYTLYVSPQAHPAGLVDVAITNPGGQTGTVADAYEFADDVGVVDADEDFVDDSVDNCLDLANTNQADLDEDGIGDACDDDWDGDTFLNDVDLCPWISDDQSDGDADGIGDACDDDLDDDGVVNVSDNCAIANPDQADQDADGIGDACDLDANGDGILDVDQVIVQPEQGGCSCSTGSSAPMAPLGLGLLALVGLRRRRE